MYFNDDSKSVVSMKVVQKDESETCTYRWSFSLKVDSMPEGETNT